MSENKEVQEILNQVRETMGEVVPELLDPETQPATVRETFTYRDCVVIRIGGAIVCTTTSRTMARRIANALNQYTPGNRGF